MAFFRQLGLLLWKNGLSAFRQPLWSLTLLAWPLITFLIILVTRHQFPPVLKETCYVSPRNLPSAGFFPFLQTLMCDADSRCRNTSSLVDPTDSKTSANTRSLLVQRSAPLVNLLQGDGFFNFPFQNEPRIDHAQMAILNNVFGSTFQDGINNISLGNDNATFLGDQETMNNIVSSVNQVKRSICTVTLPMMNTTSSEPLNYAMVNFCKSNSSVFEVSLLTLNQILTNLMLTKPNETVTAAEMSASMFDQLQNHSSLWDSLLQVPQLFSSSSDQVLNDTKLLLSNLRGAMNVIQNTFPTVNDSLSSVHPLLVGGINTVHYVQNWPGKGVSIPLGEIVTLQNDSLSTMMKAVLQEVQIPLHKAIGLALDKNLVHSYLCDNSSKSLLLTAACTTGTINMALGWISPDMVAKQALLAWSKDVAPHDVSFIKGMLQSLIGGSSPGGQANSNTARKRRSIDTQPQSVEEELFLSIGEVVMEILQIVPEVDVVVQNILRTGFQSMRTATQALNTVAEIMANGLKDANQLQLTYLTLTTNETQASIWIDQVLDSVIRIAIKTLESGSLTCEDLLGPFEWLLITESIKTPVWESMICQNSTLQQALLADWQPLVQEIQELYNTVTGQADFNVTLPIILAEWQKLANSSLQFEMLFERLTTELDGEYWMNWMLDNSTFDVHDTFLQSLGLFVETFGENIETSELWPEVKNYFHMVYWILDYMPGTTSHAANCSVNNTLAIHCDTGLNWPHFTEVVQAALLSPNKALVNSLEGTVNLLQHVYADVYKNLTASVLKQELEDEDALSTYLGNLTHDLDGFLQNISILPYSNISNPDIMFLLLQNLLEPTGLSPLLTLFLSDAPGNVSTVLDVASKLGRIYQPMVTCNETDPTTRDLEQLIMRFLYLEDNLTLPISHVMGYNLLNYSEHFSLDDVISLTKAIQPFTNQSSPGLVETILSAIELWKTVMDSPNNDPANITLAYIHQLRELAKSLLRLQNTESFEFPIEQLTITQVNQISEDIINFLSPESLKTLTENGPDAALSIVIQKFAGFLPLEVQQGASPLFQDFRDIGSIFSECAKDQNCSTQVSEIFSFLNEIVDMMSLANANITHEMLSNNSMLYEYEKVRSMFFSLILSQIDETNMTLNHTLQFIGMIMDTPNISVSEIQNALEQSNLTLEELKNIAELAQSVNISKLLDDVMGICNARQCLETEKDSAVTAKCVMGLIDGISSFLRQLPSFHNETTILLQIPLLINKTIGDMIQVNFSSSPNMALKQTLYSNLANIKLNLQLNQLNTPEIMMELKEVEELIQLFANTEESFNSTLMMDPIDAQKVYLEIMEWYLEKMENITSNSSFSELIHPFFYITQMQITLQLAQTDFALYVSNQYKLLMNSLQYPLDNAGVSKIGETVVEVLQHLFDLIPFDLEVQNATLHSEMFNTTILNATEHQIKQCLDVMQKWMIQPNVSSALTSLLNWGNSSINVSTHATDIQQLLKSLDNFDLDQVAYLSAINNITQSLRNALTVAELSGGLQSDDFSDAILDAVQSVMQIWTEDTEDLPVSTQKDILDFVRDSLKLIVQPDVSFASSRDIPLLILKTAENVIQHTAPDMFSDYITYGLKVVTTFFESAPTADMAGDWSEMISNEMKIAVSFLPPNSTAQAYASALINITYSVLESHLSNMSVWSSFENATEENVSLILDQMSKALSMLWPLAMDGPGSFGIKAPSLESFDDLASVLEMVMTGKADEDTWENLEEMLESLLSTLEGTEQWGNISSAIPHFETIIGTLLNIEQAENEMILSLQMPVLTLMGEVAQSANNTHLNLSDISERMQLAVQSMANGTSECGEVLKEWDPVREAAGLSHAAMAMWCNVSLQPLLESLTAAQTVFSHLNMSDMDVGPANGSNAAERIVNTVQSLYQVSVNQRLVTLQLIRAVSDQLAMLASQPLSPEAQLYWQQHLQDTKFLDSLSSINFQLLDEVLNMGPFIIPYIKAMEKALDYTLNNYYFIQNRSTSDERFEEEAMIYLTTVNTTLDNMLSLIGGNLTGLNESTITDTARKAFKLLKHWQVFSDDPMIYLTLKQFLESNDKRVILQKVANISTWLASVESNMTSDIFSMISGKWPGLNETSFTNLMRDTVTLLSDHEIFGDEPMIYQALEQFLESSDTRVTLQKVSEITAWFASSEENMTSDNIFSMIWGNWSRFNQTSFATMTRDALTLLSDQEMFGDEPMIYQALEQFLEFNDKTVILQKVAEITRWLSFIESNLTLDNTSTTIWGNWSGLNETSFTNMMREAVKLLSDQKILGDDPMIYEALEQFVASSDKRMILQNVSKITALLASVEANMTSDNIFSMVWGNWSRLNETSFANMMSDALKLLSDHKIFGDEPMFYQTLEQLLEANDKMEILTELAEITAWLASTETNITSGNISMIWGNWSGLNETSFANMMSDALKLLSDQKIFGDEPMIYQILEQVLLSNDKRMILTELAEFTAWLASVEANMTSDIFSRILGNWSRLNETYFINTMREAVKLLSDQKIFGEEPMIYQILEQFVSSSDKSMVLQKVSEITALLASFEANMTSDNIFSTIWGNWSRLNETSFATMLRETVKMMSDQEIFGDEPMIYQALEKFLESNDKTVILQTVAEISTLLASFEANITSNIFSTVWGNWSGLNETSYTNMMREAVQLLSDQKLFGDDPMIYQALEQFVASSDKRVVLQKVSEITALLASNEANITSINIFSTIWGNWSRLNETSFANMMKECVKLLSDQQIFGDKPMIYQTLEQFLEFNDKRVILQTLAEISTWLASEQTANITSDQFLSMMLGNWSRLNETSFTNMINEALEQLLASNRTSLIAQKGEEMSVWLTSIGANITSDIIFSVMWSDLSGLTETHLTDMTKEAVKLMSDLQIFGDQPMIYQELDQFLASSNTSLMVNKIVEFLAWLSISEANSSSDIYSMLWGEFSTLNETISSNMMWEAVKLIRDLHIFGDTPMIYQILGSNDTSYVVQKMTEMSVWLVSTEASGLDLLTQALPKMHDIVKPLFSVMKQMSVDMQGDVELIEELAENVLTMLKLLGSNSGLPLPMDQYQDVFQQDIIVSNYTTLQQRREGLLISPLMRDPMDDFTDLFFVNYPAMFEAISVPPTTDDFMETVHMFFNNPNLNVVLKGASVDIPWGLNASREETIDAALGMLSSLTLLDTAQKPFMSNLANAVDLLPDGFPFSSLLKNFTRALANEYQENLNLTDQIFQTVSKFPQMNVTDPQFTEQLDILRAQVCALEGTESVRLLMLSLSMEPGQLCYTFLPSLEILLQSVVMNMTSLTESIFQAFIGDPSTYNIQPTWASVLTESWGVNISSLSNSLNINISSPEKVTISELLRNETAFVMDVQQRMNCDPAFLSLLMNATLPDKNVEILSWLVNLRHCGSTPDTSDIILQTFCSMSVEQWYTFSLLMARHINIDNVFYRVVLSEELQSILEVMLGMAKALADMMDRILPAISQLQNFMMSFQDLNLVANNEFKQMTRGRRSISSQATFATLSRALCSNSIKSLFDITQPTLSTESSYFTAQEREDLMDRFNIPRNATPFCENLYLDMVNTAQGAVAWAFLKPMLMGQILYTPDTPVTRAIMEKANATLQEFANLRKNSENWIKASDYIFESSAQLSSTLPMLQNSLGNSFVKNFIEMHTDISVDKMKETLSSFSNMTLMLERNRYMVKQITTLSSLMVNLSSCVTFDRYRGFDSADELNSKAQELAKKRDLYASVIFKLPNNQNSSTSRPSRSLSTSSLPPRVSYTIRMHMDNVMRTDRVRDPYFVKDTYIFARRTMRYNRGFLYLQESIDRAIIETQVGQRVTEPAVQLQPFPYPCFQRDEYLQAMSYVFPVMLMIAWVLFVADFVRKLVHERELRLHEYMKMMGVNPLSHFFAWFLECAAHLLITTFILTLILKYGQILPNSDGFLLFLYLCDYGLSILAFSYLVSSFFDKTYIAGLSGSLLYILCFFPYIMVIALETNLTVYQKSALSLFAPTCFSYASQYVSRYESQGEGIYWSNAYTSPIVGDTASFGWLCWLMFIDSILYFIIGAYIRMVFPGQYGIPAPWYFPFTASFWSNLCCSAKSENKVGKGLLITNIMQRGHSIFDDDDKGKGQSTVSTQAGEDYSQLPVGVSLHGLSKLYGNRAAIENLNVSFYEGHVTSLLGHNGAGKTTTMSLLTGLFPPSSGAIEVYGRDMQANIDDVRKELGVCMQYDVLFDHLTTKEHLLLYGQIKAPHWSPGELREQVRSILEETGMYAHRHKLVGTLSGGMKRKLSISIAFIGGSRLVVLDEPTTGVDPCSRRSIWDIVIQNKKHRTIIMSTHHLDEAEVLSDRIAFLERGGLKCCGSPFYLKDKLGQGYKLTLTKKPLMQNIESEPTDNAELKTFVQAHMPEARLKDTQGSDLVYSLPPFTSSNASSYRSLLTALDSNLDALQLGGYGISDTTLEEVFLQLTRESVEAEGGALSVSETLSDTASIDSFSSDLSDSISNISDRIKLTGSSMVRGMGLAWQQMSAMLIKRFHHSRRDWKGLIAQILLPVLFMVFAMCLGSIKSNLKSYPDLELSPALYKFGPSYSFFRNLNPNSSQLVDAMTSFPGIDNACLDNSDNPVCKRSTNYWTSSGNTSKPFKICKCTRKEQFCDGDSSQLPHKQIPSSQILYNLSGFNVETYLIATANDFIRNRYGGFDFGLPLPADLQMDLQPVPKNRTLSKIWYNPEGYHTMPAYLNSLSNFILRSSLPADKDPREYAISVSSHPYFGREDDDDIVIQGMLQILVAVCVLTGYSITVTSFAIYEVKEHHSGSKRLQHIAGISEPFYWTVNFFYDMLVYMIPVTLTLGVIAAFQIPAFTDRLNLGAIALLLVLFGFATFPWMYLLSDVFKDAEMAFITYVCINLFISVNTIMSTSILYFLSQLTMRNPEAIKDLFNKLSQAFLIFPQFNFGNGLMELARMNIQVQILSGYGIDAYKNPFSTDCLGWMFISSFIQGVVFFTLRLLLNKSLIRKVRHLVCAKKAVPSIPTEDEDDDVATEHLRVSSGAASSDILQVNKLTKVYEHLRKKVFAVKRVSVGIPAGECFGLLGVNGAGKTTTFKMLTGDVSPTEGTAQIKDWDGRLVDIMECRSKGINIGYCPQVDALDSLLTGEEHLYFYARIRGISKKEIEGVVNYLLKRLELNYHRKIISDSYSCGTRRKLSTALALIGHPQILLLDEPSSGMDPRTKRHLWRIISEEVKGKCAVVLTSHSMEECEALCSRLAIMVKGQFRCLGSLQHIKNRFGSGFTVKMYLAKTSCDAAAITGFMQRQFPSTYLKDQHSNMVEYHIPNAPGGVADIFDQLESNKNALQIKHFSVSQTTLDEVFINFATEKIGMESISVQSEDESEDLDSIKDVEK